MKGIPIEINDGVFQGMVGYNSKHPAVTTDCVSLDLMRNGCKYFSLREVLSRTKEDGHFLEVS